MEYFLLLRAFCCSEGGSSRYDDVFEHAVSQRLSDQTRAYATMSESLRSAFSDLQPPNIKPVPGHTHGAAAADRTAGSALAATLGTYVNRRVVYYQMSRSDQRKGRTGTRTYYWGKDVNAEAETTSMEDDDLLALIDVDYHREEFPSDLARWAKPTVIYTFQPHAAAFTEGDTQWQFLRDGRCVYNVGGGGEYTHRLWNYSGDSFAHTEYAFCGLVPRQHVVFSIERKQVGRYHQIVLLAPMANLKWLDAWFGMRQLAAKPLKRLNPVEGGEFVRLQVNTNTGISVSTARVGGYSCATVPAAVDDAISVVADTEKLLTHATVVSKMNRGEGSGSVAGGSEVLHAYHKWRTGRSKAPSAPKPEQISLLDGILSYQYVPSLDKFEPGVPSMTSFMNPILGPAYVPERSKTNDERTVHERVKKPQLHARASEGVSPFLHKCMEEFVGLLGQHIGHLLDPVDYETVYEKQSRPTQRRILEEAEHQHDDGTAQAMQKAEAYPTANNPRNITILNGVSKREHSKWMYALYAAMADIDWYAFGKSPCDIAELLTALCADADWWADSDFEKQDGHVHANVRFFERLLIRLFRPCHWEELLRSLRSQTWLNVKTKFGVRYNSEFSRASGSAETAVFNTILTAFIMYLAFRMSRKKNGEEYSPQDAWDSLGLYGGDDGGTPNLNGKVAEKAAKMMGQKLEVSVVLRGEPGVQFLARYYGPGVWFGDSNSCCDVRRQLLKFHTTTHLSGITAKKKLLEKSYAFSLCDSETPVIGHFVKKVLALENYDRAEYTNVLNIWNSTVPAERHYPNAYAPWMDELVKEQSPVFDLRGCLEWIDSCASIDELIACPGFEVQTGEVASKPGLVVVDGEVHLVREPGVGSDGAGLADGHKSGFGPRGDKSRAAHKAERAKRVAGNGHHRGKGKSGRAGQSKSEGGTRPATVDPRLTENRTEVSHAQRNNAESRGRTTTRDVRTQRPRTRQSGPPARSTK